MHLPEQDTTDFEKCLYATDAPLYVAAGFTGRRVDHMLAVFHAMLRRSEKRVVLLGEEEAMALVPPGRPFAMDLEVGAVVSFYPLLPARGTMSEGLEWSVDGLALAPGEAIGTSNRAVAPRVEVGFDAPGVLVLVARQCLGALIEAVR
ncbi:MAG: thiamine pyrophosphokinase [Pseudomonadota bacterium]